MAPSRIRKALGAVKDQTTIGLAKVSAGSSIHTELEITVVKATRHDNRPAEERHIREVLALSHYSRQTITLCVATISRRLSKTRNWTVALKALILVHRLLADGDPAYEEEVFFATRRGTRLLNLSDFRDRSSSTGVFGGSWDYSAFVRTFARYLDERLEYRMQGRRDPSMRRRRRRRGRGRSSVGGRDDDGPDDRPPKTPVTSTPVREMNMDTVLNRSHHLMLMIEKFIACRPTGAAKDNPIVAVALYPLVKESIQNYYDLTEIMAILVDRFMELDVSYCVKVYDLFTSIGKLFDELGIFYSWCRNAGIARSSDYPEVEKMTQKKLELMDEFIRERSTLRKKPTSTVEELMAKEVFVKEESKEEDEIEINVVEASPEMVGEVTGEDEINAQSAKQVETKEVDLLNLYDDDNAVTSDQQGDKLALALFDCNLGDTSTTTNNKWETFAEEHADWETALVESISNLPAQKPTFGGGLDTLILDGMYQQPPPPQPMSGSTSSIALIPALGNLPLPTPETTGPCCYEDPFAASAMVEPPTYVQMVDMSKKQRFLVEEQLMWQQYTFDGMQGSSGLAMIQRQQQQNQGNNFNGYDGYGGGDVFR